MPNTCIFSNNNRVFWNTHIISFQRHKWPDTRRPNPDLHRVFGRKIKITYFEGNILVRFYKKPLNGCLNHKMTQLSSAGHAFSFWNDWFHSGNFPTGSERIIFTKYVRKWCPKICIIHLDVTFASKKKWDTIVWLCSAWIEWFCRGENSQIWCRICLHDFGNAISRLFRRDCFQEWNQASSFHRLTACNNCNEACIVNEAKS